MNKKENHINRLLHNDYNFLLDDDFIRWRLFQTKEMDEYWDTFITDYPHLRESIDAAIRQFDVVRINRRQLPEVDKSSIYHEILQKANSYKRRMLLRRTSSVAAIFVIAILSLLFIVRKANMDTSDSLKRGVIIGETLPEEEIYIISGDEKINIAHKSHIDLTLNGKVLVTDSCNDKKELLLASAEINELVVPYGKRTNLTLADGTEIWLNSGTQLEFPAEFTASEREISVKGEIFINVAHDPERPFIVHVRDMDIYVHGTSFNVSAYHDDGVKTIVLVEGKVKVKTADNRTAELLPKEKLEITAGEITKEVVNVSEYISWTKGVFEFEEASIAEILKKIGRYYNVHFESLSDMKLNDKSYSGKLYLSNNLDSVMMSVSVLSSTIYERENNVIHITKK